MSKCIFIQGLPGSGKTTLASLVRDRLNAVHFNADWARNTITSYLGFSEKDRLIQAKTLGQIGALMVDQNRWCVIDFICPTKTARHNFFYPFKFRTDVYSVWMNTIAEGRFEDTNKLYQKPGSGAFNLEIQGWQDPSDFEKLADSIVAEVTKELKEFYIRYNTNSDGETQQWRIIEADTGSEILVDDFEVQGRLTPAMTVEHGIQKWNVKVRGTVTSNDKRSKFTLIY